MDRRGIGSGRAAGGPGDRAAGDGRVACGLRRGARGPRRVAAVAGLCVALLALLACGPGEGADAPPPVADGDRGDATSPAPTTGETADREAAGGETESPAAGATQEAGGGDAPTGSEGPAAPGTARITVAGHPVTVEVADDDAERQRGLMFRDSLPEDHGMLFVYEAERRLSFWMRNTHIPLDVAFIDRGGRIVDIQQMEPMTEATHTSRVPALYALEMRLGWFEDHGVGVGDTVEF